MPQPLPQPSASDTAFRPAADSASPAWDIEAARTSDKDAAKRSFLRMVSHELRTPLNSIIGFSEILRQELYGPLGSPQYVEYAGIISDSGTRLLNLFNNFLDIVRLEGGSDLVATAEPVLPSLQEAVARVRALADSHGVRLHIRLSDDELYAMFDPRGLAACLDHLLRNAIDFTAAGDTVEINARLLNDRVDITVFNRGAAPDQSEIERLMKPFEQGEGALNRTHEGAGLGWAIVKLNAEAMGGIFGVLSRKGECLKAIIRLPQG